jgi:hypothetical protein
MGIFEIIGGLIKYNVAMLIWLVKWTLIIGATFFAFSVFTGMLGQMVS